MMQAPDLLMDFSILQRSTQKYYDRRLEPFRLTYGQLPVLLLIFEHPGITLNEIVVQGQYDKGTVTRNVQKLQSLGYVDIETSPQDKRAKCLYPTDAAKQLTVEAYRIREDWWKQLLQGLEAGEVAENARRLVDNAGQETGTMPEIFISSVDYTDLRAWPGKVCAVIHTSGCNFRCPACPHKSHILPERDKPGLEADKVLDGLDKRKDYLDGVVISGGEPLMQQGLEPLLKKLKLTGLPVRLETNGSHPEQLKQLLEAGLVHSAMVEVKNSPDQYAASAGLHTFDAQKVKASIDVLEAAQADYTCHLLLGGSGFDKTSIQELFAWLCAARNWKIDVQDGFDSDLADLAKELADHGL